LAALFCRRITFYVSCAPEHLVTVDPLETTSWLDPEPAAWAGVKRHWYPSAATARVRTEQVHPSGLAIPTTSLPFVMYFSHSAFPFASLDHAAL
jgi:hypothetical protein